MGGTNRCWSAPPEALLSILGVCLRRWNCGVPGHSLCESPGSRRAASHSGCPQVLRSLWRCHANLSVSLPLPGAGQSIVGCKAILIEDQVFVVVAQLFGGSHIYKYDESWTKFVKFQDIEVSRISKPNDIELFQIDADTFFIIADSSKAGLSTVYKWNSKGFYSYQSVHEWFRDTDAEFVDIDGKSHLILSSRSQVPIILQWNKSSKKFVPHGDIPNMEDVLAVKSFRMQNTLYLSLTRFIGDSRVMRWNSKQFVEIQALPSRGAMTLQPFSFKENHYLALGSDYTFSQIYQWDKEKQLFKKFKEIYVQAPRSFTAVSTDRRDFFFASSFKGKTKIFEHIIVDLSL